MIQSVMVFGIGFLSAALVTLAFIPIVHRRAVRLTTARLDGAIPVSVQELRVEKDQIRAQVASSLRRLEVKIEHLKKTNVAHQTEITKKTAHLASLQADTENKAANIGALEKDNGHLQEQLSAITKERDTGAGLLLAAQKSLAEKEMELERLAALATQYQHGVAERDSVVGELQNRLQQYGTRIAILQRDLSRAQESQLSVADLHREIDQLEARIETMAMETH